jgi:DNA-binding PadR family transcriptional regulator
MPLHHAVLALLADGSSYGYELKASFEEAIGPQWGELNIGHLYQILDRLVRDDFVTSKVIPQSDRPDKIVYRLSKKGRTELERWLEQPFVRQSGYRDDFFLKLLAASRLGADKMRSVIRVQRDAYVAELATLGELKARHTGEPLIALLIDAAVLHTEASLKFAELVEKRTSAIVRSAGTAAASETRSEGRAASGS